MATTALRIQNITIAQLAEMARLDDGNLYDQKYYFIRGTVAVVKDKKNQIGTMPDSEITASVMSLLDYDTDNMPSILEEHVDNIIVFVKEARTEHQSLFTQSQDAIRTRFAKLAAQVYEQNFSDESLVALRACYAQVLEQKANAQKIYDEYKAKEVALTEAVSYILNLKAIVDNQDVSNIDDLVASEELILQAREQLTRVQRDLDFSEQLMQGLTPVFKKIQAEKELYTTLQQRVADAEQLVQIESEKAVLQDKLALLTARRKLTVDENARLKQLIDEEISRIESNGEQVQPSRGMIQHALLYMTREKIDENREKLKELRATLEVSEGLAEATRLRDSARVELEQLQAQIAQRIIDVRAKCDILEQAGPNEDDILNIQQPFNPNPLFISLIVASFATAVTYYLAPTVIFNAANFVNLAISAAGLTLSSMTLPVVIAAAGIFAGIAAVCTMPAVLIDYMAPGILNIFIDTHAQVNQARIQVQQDYELSQAQAQVDLFNILNQDFTVARAESASDLSTSKFQEPIEPVAPGVPPAVVVSGDVPLALPAASSGATEETIQPDVSTTTTPLFDREALRLARLEAMARRGHEVDSSSHYSIT